MNSIERHEARYQRRKAKRKLKELQHSTSLGTFDDVFSYMHLYEAFAKCKQGVRWKASIQAYEANLLINTWEIYSKLKQGTWKSKGFTKFYLSERGKLRQIQSVHISERCIQRTLCDYYLVPLLQRSLIYDNGASLKDKGTSFAMTRLVTHLHKHYNRYGNSGYILLYDFTNYFGSIDHNTLYRQIDDKIYDERIKALYHQLIDAFDKGLGLGSQVSQISAVYFTNYLDHVFKDILGITGNARFMDDGYIISNDLEFLKYCEQVLYTECDKLGITVSSKKIKICKLSHGFTYLKKRCILTTNGYVFIRLSRNSFKAVRRRLRQMKHKKLPFKEVLQSYKAWRGNCVQYKHRRTLAKIDVLFNRLFVDDFQKGV